MMSRREGLANGLSLLALITLGSQAKAMEIDRSWRREEPGTRGMVPHELDRIIVHHTGFLGRFDLDGAQKLRNLYHYATRDKGWTDVPYHFYIDVNGKIFEGRSLEYAGDTNTRYNTVGAAQIVLEGDFDQEHPRPEQLDALSDLISIFRDTLGPEISVSAHNQNAQTTCPGTNLLRVINWR